MGFLDDEQIVEQNDDAVLESLNKSNQEFNKLVETKKEESVKMGQDFNERTLRASEALRDAKQAYELANVPAQSEDIRSLAITFMIDEGKNGRMTTIKEEKKAVQETVKSIPTPPPVQSGVVCSICGSGTYDNSGKKTNPKAPDYKCKQCNAVAWKSNPNKFHPAKTY